MIINGVELEFNLYDLENPELKELLPVTTRLTTAHSL